MSKYDPLNRYLCSRPQGERVHTLAFDKMERVLGTSLPRTARIDRPWWANTRSSTHAIRWLDAGWKVEKVDLGGGNVTFARIDGVAGRPEASRNRYDNLRRFFESVPAKQEQIALTFAELGALLGGKLPGTAFHDRPWWANTMSSPQGLAWMTAGWRVENVFLKAGVTTFRRKGDNPLRSIPRYVKGLLNGSAHLGRPAPRTLASWIRFSKRVGWYFEAKVLYERGGLNTDSLGEEERAGVDEDYAVCKRELGRCSDVLKVMIKGKSHV